MNKVCIFLADGFEEIEGLAVVDVLRRAGVTVEMVAIGAQKLVTGSHGIQVMADLTFEDMDTKDCVMYVLPGGMPGTHSLAAHKGLTELLLSAEQEGRKIAAICAAPSVLGGLGLLKGRCAVCYPGFEDQLTGAEVTGNPVEVSGHITTGRGMGKAISFALALAEQLVGRENAQKIAESIVW